MTQINNGGPAFPQSDTLIEDGAMLVKTAHGGMTLRQYAAIKLRVPNSGTDWLDAMILEGRKLDYAGQALGAAWDARDKGYFEGDDNDMARCACKFADAMIAEREKQ